MVFCVSSTPTYLVTSGCSKGLFEVLFPYCHLNLSLAVPLSSLASIRLSLMHFHQVYVHKRDWLQPRGRLFVEACGCLGVPDKVVLEVEIADG